ncbi:MAG: XdhC family protein [Sphingobium phenoxybenzoativorans]
MTETEKLWAKAREWRDDPMALATVISTWGSAPRPRGSHMLINADGRFEGSVSGGCVEGDILQTAASVIADGVARSRSYGVSNDNAWEVGLPCGGEIAVLVQPVSDHSFPLTLLEEAAQAGSSGHHFTISTNLESGVSRAGDAPGMFVNIYRPPRRMIIVGAVQIAQSLAAIAQHANVSTIIVDPRGRFLTPERFPGVELDDRWPDEAIAALKPDSATAVVTLSHDTKIDDPGLMAALRAPTGYIAALGSRKSHAARLERLAAAGFSAAQLARIEGPAGIDIAAIGPAEIALSICAGMVKALNGQND